MIEKIQINTDTAVPIDGEDHHTHNIETDALDTNNEKNPLETEVSVTKTPITTLETVETASLIAPLQNARNQMMIKVVPPDNNTPMQAWST